MWVKEVKARDKPLGDESFTSFQEITLQIFPNNNNTKPNKKSLINTKIKRKNKLNTGKKAGLRLTPNVLGISLQPEFELQVSGK